MKKIKIYTFQCPICEKFFKAKQPAEPCCTGPSEMRDEHDMAVMRLLKIDEQHVPYFVAEKHAKGPLIVLPTDYC